MVILETDFRWQRVWVFLTLDDTNAFLPELWCPIKDHGRLVAGLKAILDPAIGNPEAYLSTPGQVVGQIVRWFTEAFTTPECALVNLWENKIYISQGSDRLAEWGWSMLAARLRKDKKTADALPAWVTQLLEQIKADDLAQVVKAKEKLQTHFGLQISDWDSRVLKAQNVTRDDIQTTIGLIAGCNSFTSAWEKYAGGLPQTQLEELNEIGSRIAAAYQLDSQGWAYPGVWRTATKPFLNV